MSLSEKSLLEFGDCTYSFPTRTVFRGGHAVPMEPLATEVLEYLLINRHRIVSRQELIDNVWKTHVTRVAVDYQISAIRKAIGDDSRVERYIANKPKQGWILAVEVRELSSMPGSTPSVGGPQVRDHSLTDPHQSGNELLPQDRRTDVPLSLRAEKKFSRKPSLWKWGWVLVGIAVIIGILGGFFAWVERNGNQPRVVEFSQLTNDGRLKWGPVATNGREVFFSEQRRGERWLVSVPATGGDPMVVPGVKPGMILEDLAPDGGSLLLLDGTPDQDGRSQLSKLSLNTHLLEPEPAGIEAATWAPGAEAITVSDGRFVSSFRSGKQSKSLFELPRGRRATFLRWSPNGRFIRAWLRKPGDQPLSVWDFDAEQHELRPVDLSSNPSWSTRGSWVHNGRFFAYAAGDNLRQDLWLITESNVRSKAEKPLRLTTGPGSWIWPAAGPDRSTIFALREENRSELVTFNFKSGAWQSVWDSLPASELDFSRDGKWVAFVHMPDHALWRSQPDGSNRVRLTRKNLIVHQPHWSPDGSAIAFMGQKPDGAWRIFVASSQGGTVEELAPSNEDQGVPSWSADGHTVVFGEMLARKKPEEMSLRRIDLTSHKVENLEGTAGLWSPRWSPDGKYLLAVTTNSKTIRLLPAGASRWVDLLSARFVDNVTWSYDSKFIYFDGLQEVGNIGIYRASVPNGRLERLTTLKGFVPSQEPWYGVAPNGALLAASGFHSQEIFALKCVLP